MLFFNSPEAILTITESRRSQDGQQPNRALATRPTFSRRVSPVSPPRP